MIAVIDPFMADIRPSGIQRGRGGFLRSADDAPYVSDPSGETCKTGSRKGEVKRVKYGSPSGVGRLIENDVGLTKYKQRLTLLGIGMDTGLAEACRDLVVMDADTDEFRQAADKIAVQADSLTRSWLAADRGSHGHLLCELFDRGQDCRKIVPEGEALGIDCATQKQVVNAWEDMIRNNGLEVLAIEAPCVDDRWHLAGTLDRIVRLTRPLRFAMPGGEVIEIPASTVLVLDIKFGQCRRAHLIQIASYAQSVPYDTDTEERGEWPWPIDQDHALIAKGDFGGDGRPVTIELVWVDLTAGREHGGETVALAKSWATRDDLWSVAQLDVEGVGDASAGPGTPSTTLPADCPSADATGGSSSTLGGEIDAGGADPSPASPVSLDVEGVGDTSAGPGTPSTSPVFSHFVKVIDHVHPDGRREVEYGPEGSPPITLHDSMTVALTPDPARLALVQARDALCPSPDEGGDWSSDEFAPLWDELKALFATLDPAARAWRGELVGQAQRRGVAFHAQGGMTERRFYINKAVISLAVAGDTDDILRELLAHIIGDVALFPGVEPGHALGSLSDVEAERFARHVDAYLTGPGGDAA